MRAALLIALAAPATACGGVSYVDAPTTPAPAPTTPAPAPTTPAATTTSASALPLDAGEGEGEGDPVAAAPPAPAPSASAPTVFVPAPTVFVPAPPAAAPTPLSAATVSGVVGRTASFYTAVPFECDLDLENTTQPKAQTNRTRLHLSFERPGRFHVAFSTGAVLVVSSGVLYLSDPKTQQVFRANVANDYTPIAFAYAGTSFASRATFIGYPGTVLNAQGYEVLVATPSAATSGVRNVLYFDAPSGEVKRTLLVAGNGVRQRIDVVKCTMNTKAPAPLLFVPPSGPTISTISAPPLFGIP